MPVQALHHRARFAYPARGISAQTRRFASRWSAAHSPWLIRYIDPLAVEAATWIPEDARLAHLIPEPVKQLAPIARKTAREALGIPTTGRYLSLIGVIDKRKGLNLLLHAFEQADLGPDVRLLLAGKHSDFARRAVRSSSSELVEDDRVIVLDRFLSAPDFWLALCASDLVCAPYPTHIGSSGIVARAAYLERPVLASDFGWIGEATRRFGLGTVVDVSDHVALTAALQTSTDTLGSFRPDPRAREFVAFNTPEQFKGAWLHGIGWRLDWAEPWNCRQKTFPDAPEPDRYTQKGRGRTPRPGSLTVALTRQNATRPGA